MIAVEFLFNMAYKEIGILHGYNDSFLTVIGCLCAISNCSGRITWGTLCENYPFKKLYSILLIGQTALPLTLQIVSPYKYLFGIWVVSTVFFTAGNFTIFPPFSIQLFGMNLGGAIYSYLTSSFAIASILLFFGNIYILPYLGYDNLLFIAGILSGCNYLLISILNIKPKWPITLITLNKTKLPNALNNNDSPTKNPKEMGPMRVGSMINVKSFI